ncbi:hypothetical protein GJV77_11520 [Myroides pelagicus]|uniref:Uncharacterized protein n=1 Tax=Myroides pelagicus TaxID=270914 RepID=A0A7K1GNW4_9FLAO|nr:hypothetical protein [Myroides pelagicus]
MSAVSLQFTTPEVVSWQGKCTHRSRTHGKNMNLSRLSIAVILSTLISNAD